MTGHGLEVVKRGRAWVAVCECGYETSAPTEKIARERHEVHRVIRETKAALAKKLA